MKVDVRNITYHALAMSVLPCIASAFADTLGFAVLCLWEALALTLAWAGIRGLAPTATFNTWELTYLAAAVGSNAAAVMVLIGVVA